MDDFVHPDPVRAGADWVLGLVEHGAECWKVLDRVRAAWNKFVLKMGQARS